VVSVFEQSSHEIPRSVAASAGPSWE
jgi:hypothetical protein